MTANNKQIISLQPKYMQQFSCIGGACEDGCCSAGWNIAIDRKTYKKYQNLKDPELKPKLDSCVVRNKQSRNDNDYAKIILDSKGACPMLTTDGLCSIHKKHGDKMISDVCATYPRSSNIVDKTLEMSATVSCPEIARLVLLSEQPLEFDQIHVDSDTRYMSLYTVDTQNVSAQNKLTKYFWDLRIFSISLLQNRSYTIEERLIILGMFLQAIDQCVQSQSLEDIPNVLSKYTSYIETESLRDYISNIPSEVSLQVKLVKELLDYRHNTGQSVSSRYQECIDLFLEGLQITSESSMDTIVANYVNVYSTKFSGWFKEKEHIMENYLVNYVFKNIFPFKEGNVFESFIVLVVNFALIKGLMVGVSNSSEGLTEGNVVKLVQSYAKNFEHNVPFMNDMLTTLKENNLNTLGYMTILLKN